MVKSSPKSGRSIDYPLTKIRLPILGQGFEYTLDKKVLFLTFFCVKTVPLGWWGTKTVLLGEQNYGQPNSTLRGAVSASFFSK